jgi:hypothetical protein
MWLSTPQGVDEAAKKRWNPGHFEAPACGLKVH